MGRVRYCFCGRSIFNIQVDVRKRFILFFWNVRSRVISFTVNVFVVFARFLREEKNLNENKWKWKFQLVFVYYSAPLNTRRKQIQIWAAARLSRWDHYLLIGYNWRVISLLWGKPLFWRDARLCFTFEILGNG